MASKARLTLLLVLALSLLQWSASQCQCSGAGDAGGDIDSQLDEQLEESSHVKAFEKGRLGYEKLEEYLQRHVRDERPELNMEAAQKLLDLERAKQGDANDKQMLRALEDFVALDKIKQDEHSCNEESYHILAAMNRATRNRVRKLRFPWGVFRRIELVLGDYAREHALRCQNVYPVKFQQVFASLDRHRLSMIDALVGDLIGSRIDGSRNNQRSWSTMLKRIYASFIQTNNSFKTQEDAQVMLNHIANLALSSPDDIAVLFPNKKARKLAEDSDEAQKIKELVVKYLIEPCQYYNKEMGPAIFLPAMQDSYLLSKSERVKPSLNDHVESFVYGWARYGFCSMLERDQNILSKKIVGLALKQ